MLEALITLTSSLLALTNTVLTVYFIPIIMYPFLVRRKNFEAHIANGDGLLRLAVIVPAYRENHASLKPTVESIVSQNYPREMFRVYFVLEGGDYGTFEAAKYYAEKLRREGVACEILVREGHARWGKADALNYALKHVMEDVYLVFDADVIAPENYFMEVSSALKSGFDAFFPKVYRFSESFLGKLIFIDTVLWYDIYLESLRAISGGYIPLSGEGLAVKTSVLRKINGFPRVLTEDAMLALLLAKQGFKISYGEGEVYEKAPRKLLPYINQRVRWFQGFYRCLLELVRNTGKLGLKVFLSLLIAYMSPIAALASALFYTVLLGVALAYFFNIDLLIPAALIYWSMGLLTIGVVSLLTILIQALKQKKARISLLHVIATPLYWFLNGIVAFLSIILPRTWRRTVRD